ncbi:MAG: FAD-binding oxidoreductase [Burkholderiaceae bacterium]
MQAPPLPLVNDVTGQHPVPVWAVVAPKTIEEIADALARTDGPVSIGAGRYSMGGQTACFGSLHLDMRAFNKVISFSPQRMTLRVQAGIRWREVLRFIDPHDASVRIMQPYANFTVGGSLSVNAHGSQVGLGPIVRATRWIRIVLADGSIQEATPTSNEALFYGAIGGYGALGVIAEAEIELMPNHRLRRQAVKLRRAHYVEHFRTTVLKAEGPSLHSAELYPPRFDKVRSVSWFETDKWTTHDARLQTSARTHPWHRYMVWATADGRWARWCREYLLDPLLFVRRSVHWRNFETSHDVGLLEPASQHSAYSLQEYFVPAARVDDFLSAMVATLRRYRVRGANVTIRHAIGDPGTLLAWARGETFAVQVYHKQRARDASGSPVAIWARELIDAAIAAGGSFFLPYDLHATRAQFLAAYPRAPEFFALKARLDPDYRFRNGLWDAYYRPELGNPTDQMELTLAGNESADDARDGRGQPHRPSTFRRVLGDPVWHDALYRHFQHVYRLYPEARLHKLIRTLAERHPDDESVYRHLLIEMPRIRPALAEARLALPALRRHKREIAAQIGRVMNTLGRDRQVDGYLEFGTPGRYLRSVDRQVGLRGERYVLNDEAPGHGIVDVLERGTPWRNARHLDLNDYQPLPAAAVPAGSLDLVACPIGLHHAPPERLDAFVASLADTLRYDGVLILREYDAHDAAHRGFVALTHMIYNAGVGVPWELEQRERRGFAGLSHWIELMARHGLRDTGLRLREAHDPSGNTLMAFVKGAVPDTLTMTPARQQSTRQDEQHAAPRIESATTVD